MSAGAAVALDRSVGVPVEGASKQVSTKGRLWQLEAVRGAAAFYVVLHHIWEHSGLHNNAAATWFLSHGTAAVIIFFLLSGFVIQYTTATPRKMTFRTFFLKRFIRIYPLFLIGLVLSYGMMRWTRGTVVAGDWRTLLGNLLMLQRYEAARLGSWFATFCHNEPLWSLTYEWWFYMAFYPIQRFVPRKAQLVLVCAISAVGLISNLLFPNQLSMIATLFLIWWTGVTLAQTFLQERRIPLHTLFVPFGLLLLFLGTLTMLTHRATIGSPRWEMLGFHAECFKDAVALLTLGMLWGRFRIPATDRYWSWLQHLAPISYAIYIFHYPLMIEGAKLFPHLNLAIAYSILGVVLVGFCYVCEVQLQGVINRLVFKPVRAASVPVPLVRSAYSGG